MEQAVVSQGSKSKRIWKYAFIAVMFLLIVMGGWTYMSFGSHSDLLKVGSNSPEFEAESSSGKAISLKQYRGTKRVVLVFYPGDNTPLCTSQLCSFRDNWNRLEAVDAVVLGINGASKEKHTSFASANQFPFPLLVDTNGEIAKAFGCSAIFGFIKRTVYVIDKNGKVAWVERGNPTPSEIIEAIKTLQDG